MAKRIFLIHPYRPSMAPIEEAFARRWPQATVFNLLEESLYAEVDEAGRFPQTLIPRIRALFDYAELAGADGAVFTGSTFGPAVGEARAGLRIPIFKSDEAMAEAAVKLGRRIGILCTAERAIPVIGAGVSEAARQAGKAIELVSHWVPQAQALLNAGKRAEHDALVLTAAAKATDCDVLLIGQVSMAPVAKEIASVPGRTVLTSPDTAVVKMRMLLGD
ncbi:MAG TPA: aspartate/glutamate racemase family protein [Alphaproteobacteria bacterium]|jgi:Asp/Glu/hydantoin racemase